MNGYGSSELVGSGRHGLKARAAGLAFVALLALAVSPLGVQRPALAADSPNCKTTTASNYSILICLTQPAIGATLTGPTTVTATSKVLSGTTRVTQMVFRVDTDYVLTDFQSPYTFTLPTARWVDGARTLSAQANMSDSSQTLAASIGVTFTNGVSTPPVNTNSPTIATGTTPAPGAPFIVAATGDGAGGDAYTNQVVNQIATQAPNLFLYLGDVYQDGSYVEFANWYDATFGRFRSITNPVVGNHEYLLPGAPGFFDYWNNLTNRGYSFDAGGWHFIGLNSNATQLGATGPQPNDWTREKAWLQQDLNAHAGACIIAYWHQPFYNIGQENETLQAGDFWRMLVAARATVVLNGHDHSYQRWVPLDAARNPTPTGVTEFIAGTGGHAASSSFRTTDPNILALVAVKALGPSAFGDLKLALSPASLQYTYTTANGTVLDPPGGGAGTIACNGYGTLTGTITDAATGRPVANATVSWSASSATTNAAGVYTLTKAALGPGSLTVQAAGYLTQSQAASVSPAATTSANVALTAAPGSITGVVTDSVSTQPIANATVYDGVASATTDSAGTYSLTGVPAGTYTVTASATNYITQSRTVSVSAGVASTQNFALGASPGSITGQVTDTNTGLAVAGATVSYLSGGVTTSVSTNASGSYSVTGVAPGTYTLTASAPGYNSSSHAVVVAANAATTQNFGLVPLPGTITGRVTDSASGAPIAGASVSYTSGGVTSMATTDSTGAYSLSNVAEGSYTLTAVAPRYGSQSFTVSVAPGATTTQAFVLTALPGSINGQVTDAVSAVTLANATVSYTAGGVITSASTDANGLYVLSNLAPGNYALTASATGYTSQTQSVVVTAGAATVQNFALSPVAGSISGLVTDAATGGLIQGATVSFTSGGVTSIATTGADGRYTFSGVAPGSYTLFASASGYAGASAPVSVSSNQTSSQSFSLTPFPATVHGTVSDGSSGLPITGATVSYTSGGVTTIATTDSSGTYSIPNVAEGSYSLTAAASGYVSQTLSVTVAPGANLTQNFALAPIPGAISGVVTDASTTQPIQGATVSAAGMTASTDVNGLYSLANVPPGSYTMTASAPGYEAQSQPVTVVSNATTTQNFVLQPAPGAISGTVGDAVSGLPIGGAAVSYSGGATSTNSSGAYTLPNLRAGTYTLTASATGYTSQVVSVTVAGGTATQNFSLAPLPATLSGQVTDAASGTAISGATVMATSGATSASATTDASGAYSLTLAEGSYTLNVSATNYASQASSVALGPGAAVTRNIALTAMPGTITGTVTDSVTGLPIQGATISAAGMSAVSGGSGVYTLANVAPGSYPITVTASNYAGQAGTVVVAANATTTRNFSLVPNPGSIAGHVTDLSTGAAIAAATVSCSGTGCPPPTTTDSGGNYAFANVGEGSYTITAAAPGYTSQSATVAVSPGTAVSQSFALAPLPGGLTGQVTDAGTGLPIAGATVAYIGGSATTAASGAYTLTNVPAGSYTLTASAAQHTTQSVTVVVTRGNTTTQSFALVGQVFADGFESGSLSAWTSSTGLTIEGTTVHTGTHAAEGNTTTGATYARKTLSGTYANLYLRIYFQAKSLGSNVTLLNDRTATGSIAKLYLDTTGRLGFRNDIVSASTIGPAVSLGAWHSAELHVTINGLSSVVEVWLDGTLVANFSSSTANLGTAPVSVIQIGENSSTRTYDVVVDDVAVQTSRVGP